MARPNHNHTRLARASQHVTACSARKRVRPIEPGTFPLADGVSGRMGLVRGYGNAIVPPLAAEFVIAFL
ncbi:MAG: hypothetical protein LC676_19025, partial [Loktanella sp.]|nr:hypothetical protein [Loktanella sp.]